MDDVVVDAPEESGHAIENSGRAPTIPSTDPGRVAAIHISGCITGPEPLLALRRGSVRPFLRHDVALRLALDTVVAHRRRGVERLRDLGVRRLLEEPRVRGVTRPDSGEAIRLELRPDRGRVGGLVLGEKAALVLHVMAVLVRDDVPLRERTALRPEPLRQVLEEADVEVDLLVLGAVEGPHRGLRQAARALRGAGVKDGLRWEIGVAAPRELAAPVFLDAVDEADDAAVVTLVRVGAGLALLERGGSLDGRGAGEIFERVRSEEQRDDEDEKADPAATHDDRPAE